VSLRRALVAALLALLGILAAPAAPASAHAELVDSSPKNGARLDRPPAQVTLTFTENVTLIEGGVRLVDARGSTVATREPTVDGHTLTLVLPPRLRDGSYLVDWRVVSADGHPVGGALSFGVGATASAAGTSQQADTAPASVMAARLVGYLGFSLVIGVLAFVLLCSPVTRGEPVAQVLSRTGIAVGAAGTLVGLLVQGPYVGGASMSRLLDPDLVRQTLGTPFGLWMAWRLVAYAAIAMLVWRLAWLESRSTRWIAGACAVALAVTFSGTGHGNVSGPVDRVVDTVHVLTAGVWVGGLALLALVRRTLPPEAFRRFSALALGSVLLLVGTGVVNAVLRFHRVEDLWQTRYGLLLLAKLGVVAAVLTAAAASRRSVKVGAAPSRSVRMEAIGTVAVIALTSALTLTSPPPRAATAAAAAGAGILSAPPTDATVHMPLSRGRRAELHITGASSGPSELHLALLKPNGTLLQARRVRLTASEPARDINPVPVRLELLSGVWQGRFRFPLPGTWKLTLTVEDKSYSAVVTTGEVPISPR
jgi:copper transport protein